MSRKSKKRPHWLPAVLALLLTMLVLVVLLPTDQEEPVLAPTAVQNMGSTPVSNSFLNSEKQLNFAYEELTEQKSLQAPKETPIPLKNGFPESGIALVMDDVGYDLKALKRVLALPFPVAISILPDAPGAQKAAVMAHEAGEIVMLHLPMEPTSPKYRSRMTDAFLRTDMNEAQVRELTTLALQQVPYVAGINNHMGSLLTTLEDPMKWVMKICRERSLFFVDSKTSNSSVAANIASEYGLAWGSRRIFLDHTVDAEDLKMAWAAAVRCAEQKGSCIVIAHPHAETLSFLEQQMSKKDHRYIRPVTSMLHAGGRS
ncbi:MAG: divergent polysaccharide deacetylase family protein [Mariprofundaceae bacterium]